MEGIEPPVEPEGVDEATTPLPPPVTRAMKVRAWFVKFARVGVYGFICVAGIAALVAGPPRSLGEAYGWVTYAWSLFLVAGGAIALLGYLTRNWTIEKIGIPLMSSAIVMYGLVLLVIGSQDRPGATAIGALAVAAGIEFFTRLIVVSHELRVIDHLLAERDDERRRGRRKR